MNNKKHKGIRRFMYYMNQKQCVSACRWLPAAPLWPTRQATSSAVATDTDGAATIVYNNYTGDVLGTAATAEAGQAMADGAALCRGFAGHLHSEKLPRQKAPRVRQPAHRRARTGKGAA